MTTINNAANQSVVTLPRLSAITTTISEEYRATGVMIRGGRAYVLTIGVPFLLFDAVGYASAMREHEEMGAAEAIRKRDTVGANDHREMAEVYDEWIKHPEIYMPVMAEANLFLYLRQRMAPSGVPLRISSPRELELQLDFLFRSAANLKEIVDIVSDDIMDRVTKRVGGPSESDLAAITTRLNNSIRWDKDENIGPSFFLLVDEEYGPCTFTLYTVPRLRAVSRHTGNLVMGEACDSPESLDERISRVLLQMEAVRRQKQLMGSKTPDNASVVLRHKLSGIAAAPIAVTTPSDPKKHVVAPPKESAVETVALQLAG